MRIPSNGKEHLEFSSIPDWERMNRRINRPIKERRIGSRRITKLFRIPCSNAHRWLIALLWLSSLGSWVPNIQQETNENRSFLLQLLIFPPFLPRNALMYAFAEEISVIVDREQEKIPKENDSIFSNNTKEAEIIRRNLVDTSLRGGGDRLSESVEPSARASGSLQEILLRAAKKGLGGGIPGALAGIVQVVTLMWLRTIINYQSRYGASFGQAMQILLNEGGVPRLYRGLSFALVQAPLARFVSTAANEGVQALVASFDMTRKFGPGLTTLLASVVVGLWRMLLMPIDTMKTVLQVDSGEGFHSLMKRVRAGKIGVLYEGAIANAVSSIVSYYPWFYTYSLLSQNEWVLAHFSSVLLRNAGIGLVASIISDTVVNAFRVIKTTKQSLGSKHATTYVEVVRTVLATDGWKGLFGRGLKTRILANSIQSIVFTIIWRFLADRWSRKSMEDETVGGASS